MAAGVPARADIPERGQAVPTLPGLYSAGQQYGMDCNSCGKHIPDGEEVFCYLPPYKHETFCLHRRCVGGE